MTQFIMDPKIIKIMQNFSSEVALFNNKSPQSLFLEVLRNKGIANPVSFPTKDGSICFGNPQKKSVDGFYIVQYDNNTYYVGDLRNGLRNGYGYRSYLQSELIYEGEYKDNLKWGKGKLFSPKRNMWVFDGLWSNDKKNGHGEMWKEKAAYSGNWRDDYMEGIGQMRWPDKQTYEGEFHQDFRHGKGVMYYPNGDVYTGDFREGKLNGNGSYKWHNGEIYEGRFLNGLMDGDGTVKYQLPIYGTGSIRNGSVNDLRFDLQEYDDWERNIQKSYVNVSSFRNQVIPTTEEFNDRKFQMSIKNMPEIRDFNPQKSLITQSSFKSFVPVKVESVRNNYVSSNRNNYEGNYENNQFRSNVNEFGGNQKGFLSTVGDNVRYGGERIVTTGQNITSGYANTTGKSMADLYREKVTGVSNEGNQNYGKSEAYGVNTNRYDTNSLGLKSSADEGYYRAKENLDNNAREGFNRVENRIETTTQRLKNYGTETTNEIGQAYGQTKEYITGERDYVSRGGDFVTTGTKGISNTYEQTKELVTTGDKGFLGTVGDYASTGVNKVSNAFGTAKDFVTTDRGILSTVGDYASTGANKVVTGFQNTGEAISSGLSSINPLKGKQILA